LSELIEELDFYLPLIPLSTLALVRTANTKINLYRSISVLLYPELSVAEGQIR